MRRRRFFFALGLDGFSEILEDTDIGLNISDTKVQFFGHFFVILHLEIKEAINNRFNNKGIATDLAEDIPAEQAQLQHHNGQ